MWHFAAMLFCDFPSSHFSKSVEVLTPRNRSVTKLRLALRCLLEQVTTSELVAMKQV
jgi:hypothetical protein